MKNESPVEKVMKSLGELVNKIIDDSTKEAEPFLKELLEKVDLLLGIDNKSSHEDFKLPNEKEVAAAKQMVNGNDTRG